MGVEDGRSCGGGARKIRGDFAARDRLLDRAFEGPAGIAREFPQLTDPDNADRVWIIEEAGATLAHAAWTPALLRCADRRIAAAGIGLVATDPACRGRGLAARVVSRCIEQAAEEGAEVAFLFGEARALYTRLGFVRAGRERVVRLDPDPDAADKRVRVGRVDDAARLLPLLDAHPVGVERDVARFTRVLRIPDTHLYTLEDATGPRAYCVEGKGRDLRGVVHEWGGDPASVSALLRGVAAGLTAPLWVLGPEGLPAAVDGEQALGAVALLRILRPDRLGASDPRELFGDERRPARIPFYVWGLDSV